MEKTILSQTRANESEMSERDGFCKASSISSATEMGTNKGGCCEADKGCVLSHTLEMDLLEKAMNDEDGCEEEEEEEKCNFLHFL